MSSFWSVGTIYRQTVLWGTLLLTGFSYAQTTTQPTYVTRRPASYVPDDDVIVKPVQNELSFYQQYIASDNSEDVIASRNQLQIWQKNQQFADMYGMETTLQGSAYFVPSSEEKWEYFKDRYLRYLRRRGEQPLKDQPKTWYQEYRASNEVDTIDEMEGRFKSANKGASSNTPAAKSALPSSLREKEVRLWKDNKFIFQPKLDQGIILVGFKGRFLGRLRAWVGVNGRTEVNYEKGFDSTGTRFMYNYYTDSGEYFTSMDQRVIDNLYLRYTTSKSPDAVVQDNTVMLLYAKQF